MSPRRELNDILPAKEQVEIENAVIGICFTLRFCAWVAQDASTLLEARFGGTPVAVDKTHQGM